MPVRRVPKYRCYEPKNLGLVVINGRQHYLGRYGTPESLAEYHRLVQESLATGSAAGAAPALADPALTVHEVLFLFWDRHATHYRRRDGTPTGELDNYRDALRPPRQLYGSTPARDFSPLKLKAVRKAMVNAGLSRTTINQRVRRIVRVFKWAASEELVPAAVYQALKTVGGLQKGRTEAKEPSPVGPVPDEAVEAVRPHVARQVWAMVELQRRTGMRPGEIIIMRSCDVDTSGDVWIYTPSGHKTAYRGRHRKIFLGPRAQAVLRPWLRTDLEAYLFSPKEAMEEFRRRQRAERKSKLYPSQAMRPRKANPRQRPGARYTTRSYCHAIGYGCKRAGIPGWHPHQLRHNAATWLRKEFGLDVARAVLGHSTPVVTEVYAEIDEGKAIAVMAQVG
jgi:integrase